MDYDSVKCSTVHPLHLRNCVAYNKDEEVAIKSCPYFEQEDDFGTPNWWDTPTNHNEPYVSYYVCANCLSLGDRGLCEKDRWGEEGVDNWEGVEGLDNL